MIYENLLFEEDNRILTLTINRPKALNALNGATMLELQHFFGTDLPQRSEIAGVILTGAGDRAFVAGADIKEFLDLQGSGGAEMAQRGQDIFFLIERSAVPVIAVVNGFALGGGCELAMACHMRIATPKARFGQPEVNLGIIPGYGGTQRLIQYVGKSKAIELMLTGDMLDAQEAYPPWLAELCGRRRPSTGKSKRNTGQGRHQRTDCCTQGNRIGQCLFSVRQRWFPSRGRCFWRSHQH